MTNLPSEFKVPAIPGESEADLQRRIEAERDRIADDAISTDVDNLLNGLDGLG
ncbi:hypothetical protein ACX3O0_06725 [Homoserinimonas sp. A447]